VIVVSSLVKTYGSFKALDDISLSFSSGAITGLLGVNGAGKTTLISILATLLEYDSGEVSVFGMSIKELQLIRKTLAYIPQQLAFYDNLTVKENIDFFAAMQDINIQERKNNIAFAIEINRLENLLGRRAAKLSGGEKRRLNIAIGLLNDPRIMLFDEPTVGIDAQIRGELIATIRSLKRAGRVIIYTSHYFDEIEKLCDEIVILHRGRVLAFFDEQKLINRKDIENLFLETTNTI
jgi:ABC-2 type transport system ATP-binding protein